MSRGQAVGGEHELGAGALERVEGVEELLLGADLALEELDVVDEQDVDVAVGGLERLDRAALERADELVGEGLGGGVEDGEPAAVVAHVVGDRVQEVGLAEPGRAADEQRVVGEPGHLGDGERGGVGEPVAVADDELVEGEAGVEGGAGGDHRALRRRRRAGGRGRRARRGRPGRPGRGRPRCTRAARARSGPPTHGRIESGASTTSTPASSERGSSGSSQMCQVESPTARRSSCWMRRQAWGSSSSDTGARRASSGREVGRKRWCERARPGGRRTAANIATGRGPAGGPARGPIGGPCKSRENVRGRAVCTGVHGVCAGCAQACRRTAPAQDPLVSWDRR